MATSPAAINECSDWYDLSLNELDDYAGHRPEISASLATVAERRSLADLEARALRCARLAEIAGLEGDAFFHACARLIRTFFAPSLLEIQMETPLDFGMDVASGWAWLEPAQKGSPPTEIVARHRLAIFRRGRTIVVENCETAAEFTRGKLLAERGFENAILLPLIHADSRIGFVKLFYAAPLVVLPCDLEATEIFRQEFSAILDHYRMYARSQRLATVDGLTQLYNHRFLREQLRMEFQRARRYEKNLCFIMIDIDDFKCYNDTFGHLAGDRVLAEVAQTIRSSVRDIDFVARYGGEEFALILPEISAENGMVVAEKIRKAVEARRLVTEDGEAMGAITVSCGVTDNAGAQAAEEIIERADRALYWVKRHGRNLVKLAIAEAKDA
jgi:diguanylate cyclase (GGDEF)-like protein